MKRIVLFIVSLFITVVAFAQLMSDSLLIGEHYRTFHFNKPNAGTRPALLFVLHGSGGSGEGIRKTAGKLEAIANSENLVMVYPDGYKNYWNECRKAATSAANKENIDEISFFKQMIRYFDIHYQTDTSKVFAVGTSGGGHMAYKLALTMPYQFRAITAIIANLPDSSNMDCTESHVPLPVMIINGTNDPVNPYLGGEVKIPGVILGTVRSTEETFQYWSRLAGYRSKPKKKNLPDTDPADGKTIEKYSYKKKGKPEIILLKVLNGKHDYPGDIDVYLETWDFFKRQISRTTTGNKPH